MAENENNAKSFRQEADDKKETVVPESVDAILEKDMGEIKKELGDLLLHIIFYARIASEKKAFDITDVIHTICDKLVHRHPHIYGDVEVVNEKDVKENWERLKLKEGKRSVFEGVPSSLPAIICENQF